MSACRVADVKVLNSEETAVGEDLAFEVTLDVAESLAEDAIFLCRYIVDPSSTLSDVELESVDVGNGPGLPQGVFKFVVEAPAPPRDVIEASGGALEVAGLYLSGVYRGAEFCRVGYYVRHEYNDPVLQESPPEAIEWDRLRRVLSDPRVTHFSVAWDGPASPVAFEQEVVAAQLQKDQAAVEPGRERERSRSPPPLRPPPCGAPRAAVAGTIIDIL
mmetsp:Transcript_88804/g.198574  ORF Transcript_88804/g.198574 Transcript_88804/m.198574 type:complete len:217 (+) Transcript_88804:55-705(+)